MATKAVSPVLQGQHFDSSGKPLSGGKIFAYSEGSFSVLKSIWQDGSGNVEWANPITLDSSGRVPGTIWITFSSAYNFALTKPDGTTVLAINEGIVVPDSGE